nr:annexin D1 [Ipomoea batatas]
MSTLSIPACVPPVSDDCEQLRTAFKGSLDFPYIRVIFISFWN